MKPCADLMSLARFWARGLCGAALLGLIGGCATCPGGATVAQPYTRVAYPDADTVQLQIAVRQFLPARGHGPVLWLAGASHIGDAAYYAALQKHLDQQALVLYEGVKGLGDSEERQPVPPPADNPAAPTEAAASPETAEQRSLQVNLARSLGLQFQLEAMNYDRPQFRNSDLTADQIQSLMLAQTTPDSPPDEAPPETEFQSLVRTMRGTSLFGAVMQMMVEVVGYSPRLQALTRLALIELLGRLKGDLSRAEALPPEMRQLMEVLIRERNRVVIADLKAALQSKSPPASISVVYGAAHLADMEARVCHDLKYCPTDQFWLSVFSVNTARAGLSPFEVGLVRTVIRSQLQDLQPY